MFKEKVGVRKESRNPNPFAALLHATFNMMLLLYRASDFSCLLMVLLVSLRSLAVLCSLQ